MCLKLDLQGVGLAVMELLEVRPPGMILGLGVTPTALMQVLGDQIDFWE